MFRINKSYVQVAVAACLWGCIGIFTKQLAACGLSAMQVVAIRVSVAAVLYTVYLAITSPEKLKIKISHLYYFIGTGIFSLMLFSWCYFGAIEESSMAVAAVLLYTAPIFVMLMSAVCFHEKITLRKVAALLCAFLGCVLVTGFLNTGGRISLKALFLGLGSGVGYAAYSIFGKYAMRRYSSETVTVYTFIVAAAVALPMAFLGPNRLPADVFTFKNAVCGLMLGSLCCVLPYVLYTAGLRNMEAGKASVIATFEPVVATAIGVIVFNEPLSLLQGIGIVLVLGAVIIVDAGDFLRKKNKG